MTTPSQEQNNNIQFHSLVHHPHLGFLATDEFNHRLLIFNEEGISKLNAGADFRYPMGLLVLRDETYICDAWNHRIVVLDRDGHFSTSFGEYGDAHGQFCQPQDIAHHHDHLYIADHGNARVAVYDLEFNIKKYYPCSWKGSSLFPARICFINQDIYIQTQHGLLHGNSANFSCLTFFKDFNKFELICVAGERLVFRNKMNCRICFLEQNQNEWQWSEVNTWPTKAFSTFNEKLWGVTQSNYLEELSIQINNPVKDYPIRHFDQTQPAKDLISFLETLDSLFLKLEQLDSQDILYSFRELDYWKPERLKTTPFHLFKGPSLNLFFRLEECLFELECAVRSASSDECKGPDKHKLMTMISDLEQRIFAKGAQAKRIEDVAYVQLLLIFFKKIHKTISIFLIFPIEEWSKKENRLEGFKFSEYYLKTQKSVSLFFKGIFQEIERRAVPEKLDERKKVNKFIQYAKVQVQKPKETSSPFFLANAPLSPLFVLQNLTNIECQKEEAQLLNFYLENKEKLDDFELVQVLKHLTYTNRTEAANQLLAFVDQKFPTSPYRQSVRFFFDHLLLDIDFKFDSTEPSFRPEFRLARDWLVSYQFKKALSKIDGNNLFPRAFKAYGLIGLRRIEEAQYLLESSESITPLERLLYVYCLWYSGNPDTCIKWLARQKNWAIAPFLSSIMFRAAGDLKASSRSFKSFGAENPSWTVRFQLLLNDVIEKKLPGSDFLIHLPKYNFFGDKLNLIQLNTQEGVRFCREILDVEKTFSKHPKIEYDSLFYLKFLYTNAFCTNPGASISNGILNPFG